MNTLLIAAAAMLLPSLCRSGVLWLDDWRRRSLPLPARRAPPPKQNLRDYYTEATRDYACWSAGYHMHFGVMRRWRDLFHLERMLVQNGEETLDALRLPADCDAQLLDLGCGMGAVARQAACRWPRARITGLTLVPDQVRAGDALSRDEGLDAQVRLLLGDYEHCDLSGGVADGAFAIESACYGTGAGKARLIAEARRLLKPGARLVITDGFLQGDAPLPHWMRPLYRWLCACWAIEQFAALPTLVAELQGQGFTEIEVRDLRWRVAPSIAYVPWTTVKFLAGALWRGELLSLSRWRWKNLVSPWLTMLLGLQRRHFGYYRVSARRGSASLPR